MPSRGSFSFAGKLSSTELSLIVASFAAYWVGANHKRIQSLLQHYFPSLFVIRKTPAAASITAASLLETAEAIIQATRNENPMGSCILATVDDSNPMEAGTKPRARPMNPMRISLQCQGQEQQPEAIFFTNRLSRKYHQLQSCPHVQLVFFDAKGAGYVNLIGQAKELAPEQAKDFWMPRMINFLPEGPGEDGRFTVYRLQPERIELMSFTRGLSTADRKDWKPFALVWDGENCEWMLDG